MILYHRTTTEAAASILKHGFKDASGTYLTEHVYSGVWLSNVPLDANEGAKGKVLLKVSLEIPESELAYYEWVEDGKPYREWLVPSSLINPTMSVEIIDEDEW
jgi:hypothetical protein